MTFEEYLKELTDPAARLRVADLATLSEMTPERKAELRAVWPALEVGRRRQVVRELVELAEENVELNFDAAFFVGLEDSDAQVRLDAVRGLWEYEGSNLIGPLLGMLEGDENAVVRAEAALALGRFVLSAEHGKLQERHFQEVEAGLRRVVEDRNEVQEVQARALEAAGPHSSAWVRQAIRDAYESGARTLKVSALHAMGRSCELRWLPLLIRELSSEDPELRYEAAVACGSLEDERAVPHLAALLDDPDQEVREAAIGALGEIGGREAKRLLLGLTEHGAPSVREAAIAALVEADFNEDPMSIKFGES